jgi:HSP20 family molecular chaperone IbpA
MKNNPNQQLHIEWNRQPTSGESSRFLHSNIQYGKFKLVHTFDAIVLSKKVISTYENGILRVTIPKDNSQPFIVPINGKVKDNSPDK